MEQRAQSYAQTLLDALAAAITQAALYNSGDLVAPIAVLWTDEDRQWEALLPALRPRLPLLTLGPYDPAARTGPAYYLRCMIARTLPDDRLPDDAVPILYLPGVSRQQMRAVEECPRLLQPLAELQYSGVLWTQKNARDWTVAAFLQSKDGGLDIPVSTGPTTRDALLRALPVLAHEPLDSLRKAAPLQAADLDALLSPDEVRRLLLWMNDPTGYRDRTDPATWTAFCNLAQHNYGIHPEQDGPVTAAQRLGQAKGPWQHVWDRYCEAPSAYPNLPALLRQARPAAQLALFENRAPYWPQDNEAAEVALRDRLVALDNALPAAARDDLSQLDAEHAPRREWVWAKLGQASLAVALSHLVDLAQRSAQPLAGVTLDQIAVSYTTQGWQVDAAVLAALDAVSHSQDVAAVSAAVRALYLPWLEQAAVALQQAILADPANTYVVPPAPKPAPGACILFTDALRYDIAQRLVNQLQERHLTCQVGWRLAALPTLTATAKPAAAPIAAQITGSGRTDLTPAVAESLTPLNAPQMRKLLADAGFQVLIGDDTGDPAGIAWTETGAIDTYGHEHGWKLAHHVAGELAQIQDRIATLLDHGWREVLVTTDHGWLLLPGDLPKAELPLHVSHKRKGRCAVLKEGAATDQQIVSWHWDAHVRIAVASGIACYEGGKEYEHGGISPQECIVPLLTVSQGVQSLSAVAIDSVTWRGLRCQVRLSPPDAPVTVDIRTQAGDASSSLAVEPKSLDAGAASLLVENEDHLGSAAIVVVLDAAGVVRAQQATIVGG